MSCVICGTESIVNHLQKEGYFYKQCDNCQYIFLDPMPTQKQIENFYGSSYFRLEKENSNENAYVDYEKDKEAMIPIFESYVKLIKKYVYSQKRLRLLDVGSALGFFLSFSQKHGIDAQGIEISEDAVLQARSLGRNVSQKTLGNLDRDFLEQHRNAFDCITMWDVIEHLPDIEKSFSELDVLLRKGGVLIVNTPDSGSFWSRFLGKRWYSYVPPEHVLFFNKKNIRAFLQKHGFEVVHAENVSKVFTLQYMFNMIYRWQKLKVWKRLVDFLEKHPRLGRFRIQLFIRDNMIVVARKQNMNSS